MEEKRITEKESLELIALMIENTKNNLERGSGRSLLLWGYVCVAVALGVFISWQLTGNSLVFWGWWAIPLIGFPFQCMINRKSPKRITTYIDKSVENSWRVIGICAVLTPLAFLFANVQILFVEALLVSIGGTITGLLIKYKPLSILGSAAILLSYLLLFVAPEYQMLVFAALFVLLMIVPGHLLNAAGTREFKKNRALCSES